jgi:hypothetical protein
MTDQITARQFHEAEGVEDWRVVGEGACTYFRIGSFAAGNGEGFKGIRLPDSSRLCPAYLGSRIELASLTAGPTSPARGTLMHRGTGNEDSGWDKL